MTKLVKYTFVWYCVYILEKLFDFSVLIHLVIKKKVQIS